MVKYIVAIDVTRVRFSADASVDVQLIIKTERPPALLRGVAGRTYFGELWFRDAFVLRAGY